MMINKLLVSFTSLFVLSSCFSGGSYNAAGVTPPSGSQGQGGQPVTGSAPNSSQIQEFLDVHNRARAEVGVGPLQWSPQLASYAGEWAQKLANEGGNLRHRTSGQYGENLYMHSGGASPAAAARSWYAEKQYYTGGGVTQQNLMQVGHYTQMVWRDTTEVGFGLARFGNGVVIVANYAPAGNYMGRDPY